MPDTTPTPADQLRSVVDVLDDAESYLSALHGAVGRHDHIGADLTCGGCALRDRVTPALAVARQLLGTTGEETHVVTDDSDDPEHADDCPGCEPAPAAEREPVQLRWGLDDVMYGDDDTTTTVLLSGPGSEPYWVELDPERTAALRDALPGPDDQPAPVDRAAILRETAELVAAYTGNPIDANAKMLRRAADEAAAGAQHPTEAQPELTEAERQFLTFAMDMAADEMSLGDGFTEEDEAALEKFRALATPAVPAAPEETTR